VSTLCQVTFTPTPTFAEKKVLALLCRGFSPIDIAKELCIQHRTVKQHLAHLYLRFGIFTPVKRVKLILAALPPQEPSDIVIPHFSPKQLAIMQRVCLGEQNSTIAMAFNTSEQTIKNHLREIYDKTGASSRVELTLWTLRTEMFRHSPEQRAIGAAG
jgi:DNA-binding NarL/FixJ family response regulator